MTLVYEQSGKFKGVPTYRFVAPKTLFANGTDYPPNEGFCPCLQSGIQNVSSCRFSKCFPPLALLNGPVLTLGCSTRLVDQKKELWCLLRC